VGDAVKIVKTFQAYQFAKDLEGVVRKIVKDNHVYFCVELSDSDALNKIEQANTGKTFYPGQEQTLMCCKISHVQKLSSNKPAAVSGMSKPGKRPADERTTHLVQKASSKRFCSAHRRRTREAQLRMRCPWNATVAPAAPAAESQSPSNSRNKSLEPV
jgi:hypothetical protein